MFPDARILDADIQHTPQKCLNTLLFQQKNRFLLNIGDKSMHWIGMCARFDINLWLYFIFPGLGWGIWNYFLCCWQREDLLCLRYFHCINACKPGIRSMGLDGSVILSTGVFQTYKCRMWLLSIVSEDHVKINHWSGDISLLMLFRRFWQMNLVQIQYNF